MKKRRPWRNRTLAFWLSIESVVVTLVTVAPFAMLHILDRFHWLRASTVSVLGILAVMGLVVGITATLFSRQFNRMVSGLTRGLKAVADGGFSQYLEPEEGGPLQPAYEDFNIAVRVTAKKCPDSLNVIYVNASITMGTTTMLWLVKLSGLVTASFKVANPGPFTSLMVKI